MCSHDCVHFFFSAMVKKKNTEFNFDESVGKNEPNKVFQDFLSNI